MKDSDSEQKMRLEFGEFLNAIPIAPSEVADQTVQRKVVSSLKPPKWRVYIKMTWIELATGLATLAICPQFGLGYSNSLGLLHWLHSESSGVLYYFLCGLIFVCFGGVLTGLLLTRGDARSIARSHYVYFMFFALFAYVCLVTLGTEVFIVSSLSWIPGALIGNVASFKLLLTFRNLSREPSFTQ